MTVRGFPYHAFDAVLYPMRAEHRNNGLVESKVYTLPLFLMVDCSRRIEASAELSSTKGTYLGISAISP
jgi:hypothetical protein